MAAVLRMLSAAMLLLCGVATAPAQTYPNRPVRVVVGFPPGGPTDVIARIVAQRLSESLGQQFYVENIGGAGGNTAAGQVARMTPDSTLQLSHNGSRSGKLRGVQDQRCDILIAQAALEDDRVDC